MVLAVVPACAADSTTFSCRSVLLSSDVTRVAASSDRQVSVYASDSDSTLIPATMSGLTRVTVISLPPLSAVTLVLPLVLVFVEALVHAATMEV